MYLRTCARTIAMSSPTQSTKKKINLKVDPHRGDVIDRAAAVAGKTRTEFMVDASYREAQELLLSQTTFYLSNGGWDAFMEILDNPPEPSAARKALQDHQAPWDS
ncbi:conserved hypothetical protein [Acaryochloris marina MBIC11017]|uniref:DUF1778 domain-containing protein n=2 Tax=Acaryochloris marina TaxID=155978 RepID=B0C1H5_ACAM1|nr:conserved hypothetical protein [Acaryochloris marina MBIC11017]